MRSPARWCGLNQQQDIARRGPDTRGSHENRQGTAGKARLLRPGRWPRNSAAATDVVRAVWLVGAVVGILTPAAPEWGRVVQAIALGAAARHQGMTTVTCWINVDFAVPKPAAPPGQVGERREVWATVNTCSQYRRTYRCSCEECATRLKRRRQPARGS